MTRKRIIKKRESPKKEIEVIEEDKKPITTVTAERRKVPEEILEEIFEFPAKTQVIEELPEEIKKQKN